MAELMSHYSWRNQNRHHPARVEADDPSAQLAIHEQLVRQLVRSFVLHCEVVHDNLFPT